MKAKLVLGTLVALVVFGLVGGVAFAGEPVQPQCGLGKVIDIRGDMLVVENQLGTFDIRTDGDTAFRVRGVENAAITDIHIDDVVAGKVVRQADDSLLAKSIVVLMLKPRPGRGLGKVTAIGDDELTVETRKGDEVRVLVDAETVFRVKGIEEPTLADIKVGDMVAGRVVKQDDGTLLAKVVAVVPPKPAP